MKILFINRNPRMGFSIGKVFKPIEQEMRKYGEVDSVELPCANYSLRSMWRNIQAARHAVAQKHYDIVHITGAEHYLLPFLRKENTVMTVHDLGFFTNHKFGLRAIKKYFLWIRTLPMAKYVTFISEKSEKEALRLVKIDKSKRTVVYDPIGDEYQYMPKEFNAECPTILHLGINPHKNLERSINVYSQIKCKFRIIGKVKSEQIALLKEKGIDYEAISGLTDDEILQEYINCDIVSFPSEHEGFGMPIIEGQSVGRPVLTSDVSPMKEIAGPGAVLVNPFDEMDIRRGYDYIVANYANVVQLGLKNIWRFRLKKITEEYYNVYKKVKK